ncbi:PAS domain-containing protein, partial [Halarsenatibacter silvermanii]|uniref:PAS domain-containing protein n=1 Tax=Halarsenatibacter silvermanii TaxID=321763 RepID=UPI001F46B0B6
MENIGLSVTNDGKAKHYSSFLKSAGCSETKVKVIESKIKNLYENDREEFEEEILLKTDKSKLWHRINACRYKKHVIILKENITEIDEKSKKHERLKERYNSIINTQKELICRFKPDTTLTFVNEAYCENIDLPEKEIIGRKYTEFIPDEDREFALKQLEKVKESHKPQKYEHKVEDENGEIRHHRWVDYPVFDKSGEIEEFQAVGVDITERKMMEEEIKEKNRLLEGVLNSIPDVIGIQKPDHTIMRYNKAGYEQLDMPPEDIKGQKCYKLLG